MPTFAEVSRFLLLLAALGALMAVLRARKSYVPMAPEWRTFVIEMIKNNTGIVWAFLVILVFLYALIHAAHDGLSDQAMTETFKTLLAGAAGWMGNMLTGRSAGTRAADQGIPPGASGSQETTTTTHIDAPDPKPSLDEPIIIQKIEEPVTVKSEENKP